MKTSDIQTDVAVIKKGIVAINKTRTKLVRDIQVLAIACAFHAHKHGDVSLINQLFDAVSGGMKQTALGLWMLDFAPVSMSDDAKKGRFTYAKDKLAKDTALELNMAKAAGKNWYDYKTEPTMDEVFNVSEAIAKIFKKLEKTPAREEDSELVAKLRALTSEEPAF